MMQNFVVTITIQSHSPGSTPVDMTWYRGTNRVEALAALVQAAAQDIDDVAVPPVMRTSARAVRMDIYDIEPETENQS